MNIPELIPYEDKAMDAVVAIINQARFHLGDRLNLFQLAKSRADCLAKNKVSLLNLSTPLLKSCEELIQNAIQKTWKLTDTFKYYVRYVGSSTDECTYYLYYEAVFSQPTVAYPIPQATASVFFRVEDKRLNHPDVKGVPLMTFRIEGGHTDHDVKHVLLNADWILAVIQFKIKLFQRIEAFKLF